MHAMGLQMDLKWHSIGYVQEAFGLAAYIAQRYFAPKIGFSE